MNQTIRRLLVAACVLAHTVLTGGQALAAPRPADAPAPVRAAPGTPPEFAGQIAAPPSTSAGSAIVMDWQTGQILYQKNARTRRDPASTTKVLTALIVLERAKLTDMVKISRRAANTPGSSMHIKAGQVYSVHDLLHGLLLRSGNDAAAALAEHVGGSVEAFAGLMNQKANALGATSSHFANPHGLTHAQHYSTAYDLAVIARTALRDPRFAEMVSTRQRPLTYEELDSEVVLNNTNALLYSLPGADGVKTGTTAAAGRCLVASATRDQQRLLAVVLRAPNRWGDSARLLEWGFGSFRLAYLGRAGDVVAAVPVTKGKPRYVRAVLTEDMPVVLPKRSVTAPELGLQVVTPQAPVTKGAPLGKVRVVRGAAAPVEVAVVAGEAARKRTVIDLLWDGLAPLWRTVTGGV